MSKRNNLGRVKRYRSSFYDSRARRVRRILQWAAGAAAVFAIGFFAAPALLNWGTHAWYTRVKGRDLDSASSAAASSAASGASSAAESTAAESAASSSAGGDTAAHTGLWSTVSLSALSGPDAIQQTAAELKAQGVEYAVVPLKDSSGYIYYASAVPSASGSIAATTIDAAAVAQALTAQGITPVAGLCAFRDPLAAYTDRTMGIHYTGTDYMWLDAKADAGGKPWLNPYSASAVQFIGDLIQEASGMGYQQVVLSCVQFPAYAGDKQDFGDTAGVDRAGQLAADIAAWGTRFSGSVTLWYEVPYETCAAPDTTLGGAAPGALGMSNLMVTMSADTASADSAAQSAPAAADVAAAMKAAGCANVVVRTGATGTQL
jgi:hypothetical protein